MAKYVDQFPQLSVIGQSHERMAYVRDRLIELARSGSLDVVELQNQPLGARTLIAQVLRGVRLEGGFFVHGASVPHELRRINVHLRSLKVICPECERAGTEDLIGEKCDRCGESAFVREPLRYKGEFEVVGHTLAGRGGNRRSIPVQECQWVYPCGEKCSDGLVPLSDAWVMLTRYGKGCVGHTLKTATRQALWRFEVVKGSGVARSEESDEHENTNAGPVDYFAEAPKKRGRPKGSKSRPRVDQVE